ncbi:unnamed protein product [Blepharisma stoltei]|uniref:Dickkopf N-terminal cysteine-rich domain-containing protein n=1 Tax=Blepharisma stoltei TaxID=1481888 RepID=A0AAU9JUQ5_9CILI|nr:unnamed protein product [Blepharisma stoltei]
MLVFLFLISYSSALTCPSYSCKTQAYSFQPQQCIYYQSNHYYLNPCQSKVVPFCQPTLGLSNITCVNTPKPQLIGISLPGEMCTNDLSCDSGVCDNGICNSLNYLGNCTIHDECNPGLYCSAGMCIFQLQVGQQGCTSDYMCINSAGCLLNTNGVGVCKPYYSIAAGTQIPSCTNNVNLLCSSGLCGTKAGVAYCAQSVASSTALPMACQTNADCVSKADSSLGITFNSVCQCSYSPKGTAYCGLFPGDSAYAQYITSLKAWYTSNYPGLCNTVRRSHPQCIKTYLSAQNANQLILSQNYIASYSQIQQNDNCTQYVYNQNYWQLYREVNNPPHDSSARYVLISFLLILFI